MFSLAAIAMICEVPGLTNIMEYFVKNYGTQPLGRLLASAEPLPSDKQRQLRSTQECTDALARAAERLPETPLQTIEDTMKEILLKDD